MTTYDSDYDEEDMNPNGSIGARPKDTDRYGFTGGNQFTKEGDITIPVSVLRKREMKWLDMLDDWDKWMTKKPKKVRERCRKGIPSSLRCRAWQRLCGGHKLIEKNHLRFQELDNMPGEPKWVDTINKDLDRQFPFHEMFAEKGGSGQQDLFRILKNYSMYNPRDGYCQAMAPVAAVLLMHMPAEEAFWCFVQICDRYLTGYYSPGLEAVQVDGEVLHSLLKKVSPATYKHMKKHGIDPILYMTEWFMCIFARTLPWSSVLRVWDIFLFEGVKVLFRVALVILKYTLGTPESLRKYAGLYEALQILKNIPHEYLGEEFLVEEMLKIHVFEKDLESQHSLTVARRKAMRSRQLSKESATDMLKKIEDLKKKKKKVRPPKSTEADETRSIISYTGYGPESPVKVKRKKEKKKAKDRDPGVVIYKQNVKSAWSEPELLGGEDSISQASEYYYSNVGTTRSEKSDNLDHGVSLGANRHTSKSEGALNVAAQYKLTRETSIDSSIHEEEVVDSTLEDPAMKAALDAQSWVDSSPSKSSRSAIHDDSSSSSSQYVDLREEYETDKDLVTFVRSHPKRDHRMSGGHVDYPPQLPGAIEDNDNDNDAFEDQIERNILDLSFDAKLSASQNDRTFSENQLNIQDEVLGATALPVPHSVSVDSGLRPDGRIPVDSNSSETLKLTDSEATIHSSESFTREGYPEVVTTGAVAPEADEDFHPPGHVISGIIEETSIDDYAESSQPSYYVETNPDFREEFEFSEPETGAKSQMELLKLSADVTSNELKELNAKMGGLSPQAKAESGTEAFFHIDVQMRGPNEHFTLENMADQNRMDRNPGDGEKDVHIAGGISDSPLHTGGDNIEATFDVIDSLTEQNIPENYAASGLHFGEGKHEEQCHSGGEDIEASYDIVETINDQNIPVDDGESDLHHGGDQREPISHIKEENGISHPHVKMEDRDVDPHNNVEDSVPSPPVVAENSEVNFRNSIVDSEANAELRKVVEDVSSSDDGTSVDPVVNMNVNHPVSTEDHRIQEEPIMMKTSPLQNEELKKAESTSPTIDHPEDIQGSIETLPLSETDSSSVSDGKANGESVNGASNSDSWLLDDLNELQEFFPGLLGTDAQQRRGKETDLRDHHRAANGGSRVAGSGSTNKMPPTAPKPSGRPPPVKPRKPNIPKRVDVNPSATNTSHKDSNLSLTGVQSLNVATPSPQTKPKSGKKPVPLPKKKPFDKRVVRGPINKSMVTDKL